MWLQPVLECLFLLRDREQDPAIVVDLLHCLHHPHGNRRRTALRVLIRSETPWSETLKQALVLIFDDARFEAELPDFIIDAQNIPRHRKDDAFWLAQRLWPLVSPQGAHATSRLLAPFIRLVEMLSIREPTRTDVLLGELDLVASVVSAGLDSDAIVNYATAMFNLLDTPTTAEIGRMQIRRLVSESGRSPRRTQLINHVISCFERHPQAASALGLGTLGAWSIHPHVRAAVEHEEETRRRLGRLLATLADQRGSFSDFADRLGDADKSNAEVHANQLGILLARSASFRASSSEVLVELETVGKRALFGRVSLPVLLAEASADPAHDPEECVIWVQNLFLASGSDLNWLLIGFRHAYRDLSAETLHRVFDHPQFQAPERWSVPGDLSPLVGIAAAANVPAARSVVEVIFGNSDDRKSSNPFGWRVPAATFLPQIAPFAAHDMLLMRALAVLSTAAEVDGAAHFLSATDSVFTGFSPRFATDDSDDPGIGQAELAGQAGTQSLIIESLNVYAPVILELAERDFVYGNFERRARALRLIRLALIVGGHVDLPKCLQRATGQTLAREQAGVLVPSNFGPLRVAALALVATALRQNPQLAGNPDVWDFLATLSPLQRHDKALVSLFDCWAVVIEDNPTRDAVERVWRLLGADSATIVHIGRLGPLLSILTTLKADLARWLLGQMLGHAACGIKSSHESSPLRAAAARLRTPIAGLFLHPSTETDFLRDIITSAKHLAPEIGRVLVENGWRHRENDLKSILVGIAADDDYPPEVQEVSRRQQAARGRLTGQPWAEVYGLIQRLTGP